MQGGPVEEPGVADPRGSGSPMARPMTWEAIKSESVAALEATIAQLEANVQLTVASTRREKLPAPQKNWLAFTTTATPPGGWEERTFYLIDADKTEASSPARYRVFVKYPPKARRVVIEVTAELRRALADVSHVRLMVADDQKLDLLRQLHACLKPVTRGPRLAELSSPGALPGTVTPEGLNEGQGQALAAMTTPGGWLVWGPPGTGKTTVIVRAVARALEAGRSVLIASHTHVAVDNVVKDVAELVDAPGTIIRVGARAKVDPQVRDHDWLMLDKAAATITNRDARLREIHDQQQSIENHPARRRLDDVVTALDEWDLDVLADAQTAREQAIRAWELRGEAAQLDRSILSIDIRIEHTTEATETEESVARELPTLRHSLDDAHERRRRSDSDLCAAEAAITQSQRAKSSLTRQLVDLEQERGSWSARLPWNHRDLDTRFDRIVYAINAIDEEISSAQSTVADLEYRADRVQQECDDLTGQIRTAEQAQSRARVLRDQLVDLEAEKATTTRQQRELMRQAADLDAAATDFGDYERILREAADEGVPGLITERDELNELVARLGEQLKDLARDLRRLEDEYNQNQKNLLESAPVIACTLAALTAKTELSNRRFDTVIIDEAASAEVPYLVYAGSKADRCLAYVGDFLQNSPISDTVDAVTDEQHRLLPWQRDDIFSLCGIRDRAGAERHPRCIALRTQYRYPRVIADIVNAFCYDGLLETAWHGTIDGPVVTFIDTADHPNQGLRRAGKSWVHPLGLDLIHHLYRHRTTSETIGLVCPYTAHAGKADAVARHNDYQLACGTSHRFQGRQFDTVILDLMQDAARPRWAAQADLRGSAREVSAAKLLNVAITRAKRRLFIIGDWNVVRRTQTPGMIAIANTRHRPEFQMIAATELLAPAPLWN
ncbi:DEAD/DEAH box helicase [Nocardia cyriacigeorgica]|nr:AAA domain-containing protein [Nocardia cyriacigeorgica]